MGCSGPQRSVVVALATVTPEPSLALGKPPVRFVPIPSLFLCRLSDSRASWGLTLGSQYKCVFGLATLFSSPCSAVWRVILYQAWFSQEMAHELAVRQEREMGQPEGPGRHGEGWQRGSWGVCQR